MKKIAQDEIKSKINEIEAALNHGDDALDGKIKMVKSVFESTTKNLASQILKTNVSLVIKLKKKQFCDIIEAKFIRIFQEKIAEIDDSLGKIDDGLDEMIKTVKLNVESVKNGMTNQIEQVKVSLNK